MSASPIKVLRRWKLYRSAHRRISVSAVKNFGPFCNHRLDNGDLSEIWHEIIFQLGARFACE